MSSAQPAPDFDLHNTPFSVRVAWAANFGIWLFIANPVAAGVWSLGVVCAWVAVLTRPLREGRGLAVGILAVLVVAALLGALTWAALLLIKSKRYYRLLYGRAIFGPIESPARRWVSAILGTIASMQFTWAPEEERYIKTQGELDVTMAHDLYHRKFIEQFDERDWPATWEKMARIEFHGWGFIDAIESGHWALFVVRIRQVRSLIPTFVVIFLGGYAWYGAEAIETADPLRLAQFTFLAAFVTASVIYVNLTVAFRSLTVDTKGVEKIFPEARAAREQDKLLDELLTDYERSAPEELSRWEGKALHPEIIVEDSYAQSVRNLYVPELFAVLLLNVLIFVMLLPRCVALFEVVVRVV